MTFLKNLFKDNKGAAITEYALLLILIAIAVMAAMILMREELVGLFESIVEILASV